MKSWLSNQSFSTWIKSHVELIKEGRNVKVIAKKYVFRCAFFFFSSYYLYTFFFFPNFLEIFPRVFSFLSVYLFLSRTWFFHDYPIIIRSAFIGFVKLEWNYWKIKIFATEDIFFFISKIKTSFIRVESCWNGINSSSIKKKKQLCWKNEGNERHSS